MIPDVLIVEELPSEKSKMSGGTFSKFLKTAESVGLPPLLVTRTLYFGAIAGYFVRVCKASF